jgi:hypothetical protein
MDLDGRLVGISSFGLDFFSVRLEDLAVSELQLRSALPVERGTGAAGASATTIATLTAQYRQ